MPQPLEIPRTFRLAHELWQADPSELVAELNPNTFNPSGTPVLICAKNEAESLPATLRSLAASEHPVMPIVVDNDSSDETSAIAEQMGARVTSERRPGKMAAFLTGLEYITEEMPGHTKILSTDADTVASSRWAGSLVQKLEDHPHDVGGVTFGLVGISGGPSRYTDILRTVVINRRQLINKIQGKTPGARGPHMGIAIGSERATLDALLRVPADTYYATDAAQRNSVVAAGGDAQANLSPHIVVARGDRYTSLKQYLDFKRGRTSQAEIYQVDWAEPVTA